MLLLLLSRLLLLMVLVVALGPARPHPLLPLALLLLPWLLALRPCSSCQWAWGRHDHMVGQPPGLLLGGWQLPACSLKLLPDGLHLNGLTADELMQLRHQQLAHGLQPHALLLGQHAGKAQARSQQPPARILGGRGHACHQVVLG
jgi:hypothetical protein